jgi:hypothetical protein
MNFKDKPLFMITSDQDWAPPWAMESLLERCRGVPLHLFRTNPCPVADKAYRANQITQGWHPNLLSDSSQGKDPCDVISYMQQHFPGCNTARNHAFNTNTHFDRLLFKAGIRVDSQMATLWQENIVPIFDISKTIRLPIFFEDDVFFHYNAPDLCIEDVLNNLLTPGLKILNIHATFIGCNTPSDEHYEKNKSKIFNSRRPSHGVIHHGRGSDTVFSEIRKKIERSGEKFVCFQSFADQILKV